VTTTSGAVDLAVTTAEGADTAEAPEIVVCSLRPLGLPCVDALPPGALDYALEVRTHGDRFTGPPPRADDPAVDDDSHAAVIARAASGAEDRSVPVGARLLLVDGALPLAEALPQVLARSGSLVIARGTEATTGGEALDRIAAEERVTTRL
jgi:uncharacterized protein (TIGR03089 family)